MHNLSYIHINQWSVRCFSSNSPLLSIHPPKLMTEWLFVHITSAQLPLELSSCPPKLMYDLLYIDNAFTQLPFPSDYPTIHPNLCSQLTKSRSPFFFLFFCSYFTRLQRLFLHLSSQQHQSQDHSSPMENGKLIPMSTGYDFSKESSGQFFKNLK